jgi:hypothetical protein
VTEQSAAAFFIYLSCSFCIFFSSDSLICEIMRIGKAFSPKISMFCLLFAWLLKSTIGLLGGNSQMSRTTLSILFMAFTAIATTGCRMCQHPYDYSGPVYQNHGSGCASCSSHGRAGSVLDGETEYISEGSVLESQPKTNTKIISEEPVSEEPLQGRVPSKALSIEGPRFGDVPGSERIISVTERVVSPDESATTSQQIAESNGPASVKSMPSKGWTARRTDSSSDWH